MRTAHYRAVTSKIYHQRSISTVDDRLKKKSTVGGRLREIDHRRSIEEEKGKKRKREKKKKRGRKNTSPAHRPRPPTVTARGCLHAVAGRGSPARDHRPQPLFLPREETERLPARGDRSRRPVRIVHTARYRPCGIQGFMRGLSKRLALDIVEIDPQAYPLQTTKQIRIDDADTNLKKQDIVAAAPFTGLVDQGFPMFRSAIEPT
ncbi:hypothetical protein GW17_00048491 [Ensete ventricosum]|nr:hypothetical protein GW17_00048491 [Ensete ventricosum]RZR86833.1 hypothetical protein BHM03_00014113 [Ensete ventricosum]